MYVWVTWLSRLLVGDTSCEWGSWFKAHHSGYAKTGRDRSLSTWKMHYTRLLNDVRDRLEAEGHSVTTERANWFKLEGNSGELVSGQADLIAAAPDGSAAVYDVGTGAHRDSEDARVMIYMYALPLVADSPWQGRPLYGRLVYRDGTEKYSPASAIDANFRKGLHDLIRRVVSDDPARSMPSPSERNWCDLTDRIDSDLPSDPEELSGNRKQLDFQRPNGTLSHRASIFVVIYIAGSSPTTAPAAKPAGGGRYGGPHGVAYHHNAEGKN